jgi:hypothetical protein
MEFLLVLLIICIIIIILMYSLQNKVFTLFNTCNTRQLQQELQESKQQKSSSEKEGFVYIPTTDSTIKRILGPVYNFHQKFNNELRQKNPDKVLGWRHWWLEKKNNSTVKPDSNFKNITTNNYLNNLDNTNNIFL